MWALGYHGASKVLQGIDNRGTASAPSADYNTAIAPCFDRTWNFNE